MTHERCAVDGRSTAMPGFSPRHLSQRSQLADVYSARAALEGCVGAVSVTRAVSDEHGAKRAAELGLLRDRLVSLLETIRIW